MNRYCILIIDDNFNAAEAVRKYGEKTRNYQIKCVQTLDVAVRELNMHRFDLVTLDIELNGENGLDEVQKIKRVYGGPIIFVSCLSDSTTIIRGFKNGADDYICKPFDLEELFYRIERSIQRVGQYRETRIDEYRIDEFNNIIYYEDKKLELTELAVKVFVLLLKNKNVVLSRKTIFKEVWDANYDYSTRVVDTHISIIRKSTLDNRIKSIRGQGYAYIDEEY